MASGPGHWVGCRVCLDNSRRLARVWVWDATAGSHWVDGAGAGRGSDSDTE